MAAARGKRHNVVNLVTPFDRRTAYCAHATLRHKKTINYPGAYDPGLGMLSCAAIGGINAIHIWIARCPLLAYTLATLLVCLSPRARRFTLFGALLFRKYVRFRVLRPFAFACRQFRRCHFRSALTPRFLYVRTLTRQICLIVQNRAFVPRVSLPATLALFWAYPLQILTATAAAID